MKRCPTCNQTFEEEWLSFCTVDGTTLLDEAPRPNEPNEPPPTVMASSSPASPSPNEQATWNLPSAGESGGQLAEPKPPTPAWQPPPPPLYAQPPNKSLATAAMVIGIISVTVGWMCFGPIPAIAAIIMGGVALSQIKKNPERIGGKQFAVVGVVTGGLTVVIYLGIVVVYIFLAIIAAANS